MISKDVILNVKLNPGGTSMAAAKMSDAFGKSASRLQRMNNALTTMSGKAKGVLGSFLSLKGIIAGFVIGRGVSLFRDFIEGAGELEGLKTGFENLTKAQGESADVMLNKVSAALDGTVDKMTIMQNVNNAILLGLPASSDKMAELADTAQRLGRAVGRGPVDAFNDLVIGIGRQSRMILDNLGLVVDTEKAYQDYAKALGKSKDELTAAEQKQAFYNAALDSAKKKVEELGPEALTVKDKMAQLSAGWKDFITDLQLSLIESGAFTDILKSVKDAMTSVMNTIANNKDLIPKVFKAAANAVSGLAKLIPPIVEMFSFMVNNAQTILTLLGALKGAQAGAAFGPIGSLIGLAGGAIGGYAIGGGLTNNTNQVNNINVNVSNSADIQPVLNEVGRRVNESTEKAERELSSQIRASALSARNSMTSLRSV